MNYEPTIGLEIHVELKTKTKMFCNSLNDPDEKRSNVNVCPVCMGHPGTLPVINKEAVRKVLLMGKALNAKLAEYSQFDRKNYFYPDLPKGYQISQYKYPLVEGGELNGVKITRIHLEEDAGRLVHISSGSAVNFNRAGIPLMELVTEPDIKSSKEARMFAGELQLILRYLDVSYANMEKGQMRVEVNISVKRASQDLEARLPSRSLASKLGTKVEIKNLNSFRAIEQAIDFEIERQNEILEKDEKVRQETRGWDENKGETFSQREKEESHDYRYFPEPDLPPLDIRKLGFQLEAELPELPAQKRERFKKEYGLKNDQVEILVNDKKLADYFEKAVSINRESTRLIVNYLLSDLLGIVKEKNISIDDLVVTPENFAELIKIVAAGDVSSRAAKDVLRIMVEKGGEPMSIISEKNLRQMSNESDLKTLAERIIKENSLVVESYKKGKEASLQVLIGQAMKETKGGVNPEIFKKILKDLI